MKQIKTISLAFDNSEIDQNGLEYLNFLDSLFSLKKAYCVHVEPAFDLYTALYLNDFDELGGQEQQLADISNLLRTEMDKQLHPDLRKKVEIQVKHGSVLEKLLEAEVENKSDLLVLGQQPLGTGHGSLTRSMVSRGSSDVLLVPRKLKKKVSKILVALDFSDTAERIMEMASLWIKALDSNVELHLLHVSQLAKASRFTTPDRFREYERGVAEAINRNFDEMSTFYEFPKLTKLQFVDFTAERNEIADVILGYAEKEGIDLLILGQKGHSSYSQNFLGSVAEQVTLKEVKCPVLFVKSSGEAGRR